MEQYVNCNRCNCNYYWYGVWDGDATVTERTRCDRRKRSNSFEADAKGRIKGGRNGRTNTSTKRGKDKSTDRNVIRSNEIIFVQGGIYSSEEKGQAALEEWKGNGGVAALKPSGDKYALVVGIASDEQGINQLMTQYKMIMSPY